MHLELSNIVDVIEVMENYVAAIRPPEHVRTQLDISYIIDKQHVILVEVRPNLLHPDQIMEIGYARATYVKSTDKWKVYWMRANRKWSKYDPMPEVDNLGDFVQLVEEDKYHCFKG